MKSSLIIVVASQLIAAEVYYEEKFTDAAWETRWVSSTWKGGNGPAGKFEWSAGKWFADEVEQKGIRTPTDMNYHSISSKFATPFSNKGKDLVVQFSVKHEAQEFTFCGGGYIKLLPSSFDQETFGGGTPYKIMFGPDICGYEIARVHLIFNGNGQNMLRRSDIPLQYDDKNAYTHLYTLVVKPDSTYKVYIDLREISSGSLHDFWDFPNKTTGDPEDRKPSDWVEFKMFDDPTQKKPADWVEEQRIRDPTARAPLEWDDEEDGLWESPFIDNPRFKGAWLPLQIQNPEYKGEWKPRQLSNPAFVEDVYVQEDIGAVGFELWTVNKGSIFDNILVTDSFDTAKAVGEAIRKLQEKEKEIKKAFDKANAKATGSDDEGGDLKDDDEDDDDDDAETIDIDGDL